MRFLPFAIGITGASSLKATPPPPDVASLARRAGALAARPIEVVAEPFKSSYLKGGVDERSWANWLIAERLIVGQYPHCQPAEPGPSAQDSRAHLARLLGAGVDCFACLQDELPPQDDPAAWPADGVRLADAAARAAFPAAFTRYAADADALAREAGLPLRYLHCPIVDLGTPRSMDSLLRLLDALLCHYEEGRGAVYLHCWGGRGRAGLVAACLLSLLRPDLGHADVLRDVQAGYDARAGAAAMPTALKRSPQTEGQRRFVKSFVSAVRAARRYNNDVDMAAAGMPKGYL